MALHKPIHRTIRYWVTWIPLAVLFVLAAPMGWWVVGRRDSEGKATWIKRYEDHLDDPIDWVKEWLHCRPLWGDKVLNISFLMENRETTWNIIASKDEVDCDPEDYNG